MHNCAQAAEALSLANGHEGRIVSLEGQNVRIESKIDRQTTLIITLLAGALGGAVLLLVNIVLRAVKLQ